MSDGEANRICGVGSDDDMGEAVKVAPTGTGPSNAAALARAYEANLAAKKSPQPAAQKLMHPPSVTSHPSSSGVSVAMGSSSLNTEPPPRAAGGASRKPILLLPIPSPFLGGVEKLCPAAAVFVGGAAVFVPPIAAIAAEICVVGWIGISPWRLGSNPEPFFSLASRARARAKAPARLGPVGAIEGDGPGKSEISLSASPSDITLSWLISIALIGVFQRCLNCEKKRYLRGGKKKGYDLVIKRVAVRNLAEETKIPTDKSLRYVPLTPNQAQSEF